MLLAGSLIFGTIVAGSIRGDSPNLETLAPQHLQSSSAVEDSASRYVQDPPQRTSFRPDFGVVPRIANQRGNFFMLRAFHDAVGESWKSTVRVTSGGAQIALGAVVGSDGWIITKASELPVSGRVTCELYDGKEYDGEVVKQVADLDLALVRIDQSNLIPISWNAAEIPQRGRWLATTDARARIPTAVGVVSAGAMSISKSSAVLGVHLTDSAEGAAIISVPPGSGADAAGLRAGDSIVSVNGKPVYSRDEFLAALREGYGGEIVQLEYTRAEERYATEGRLMDLAEELCDKTEMEVNGSISSRATGFSRVFMHDTVLNPNQCGGPLVNLDGQVVGINIARAGRVSSYALPADLVQPVVENLIEQAKLVSHPAQAHSNLRPIR